jgi:hypothetical protein
VNVNLMTQPCLKTNACLEEVAETKVELERKYKDLPKMRTTHAKRDRMIDVRLPSVLFCGVSFPVCELCGDAVMALSSIYITRFPRPTFTPVRPERIALDC